MNESSSDSSLHDTLQLQQRALEEKKETITVALKAVNRTLAILADEKNVDSSMLLSLIHSIQTEKQQKEWLEQYISEDTLKKLYNKPEEEMKHLDKRSLQLSKDIQRLKGKPIDDAEVQKMIADQMKMNLQFIGEDNLSEYSELAALKEDDLLQIQDMSSSPYSPEEEIWLQQAMAYYIDKNGFNIPE